MDFIWNKIVSWWNSTETTPEPESKQRKQLFPIPNFPVPRKDWNNFWSYWYSDDSNHVAQEHNPSRNGSWGVGPWTETPPGYLRDLKVYNKHHKALNAPQSERIKFSGYHFPVTQDNWDRFWDWWYNYKNDGDHRVGRYRWDHGPAATQREGRDLIQVIDSLECYNLHCETIGLKKVT